jgi:hypothetical protein
MPADDVERLDLLVLAAARGTITPDGRRQIIQLHKRREADLRAYDRYAANLREQIRRQERRAEHLAQRPVHLWPEQAETLAQRLIDTREAQR